jgi:hypothetical protein
MACERRGQTAAKSGALGADVVYNSLIAKGRERWPGFRDHVAARGSDDHRPGRESEVPAQAADGLVDVEGGMALATWSRRLSLVMS